MSDSEGHVSPDEDNPEIIEDDLEIIVENENVEQVQQVDEAEEATENQEDAGAAEADKKEVKVKRVRNPQPKLNVERLRGPRGLLMLGKVFEDVKFKGRGHEEDDLCVLMKNYEYWCHRLFPKFPFDDCLERIERLGSKKLLQTYLRRIRMGMLVDDDIIEERQNDEAVNEDVVNNEDNQKDRFDDLLSQTTRAQPQPTNPGSTGLSEEQLERIRINRERAQRLRKQMLIKNKPSTASFSQINSQSSEISAENNVNSVSSISSSVCDALKDIDFTEDMSVDDDSIMNHMSSQNSIQGESFRFQTTAVVHNSTARSKSARTSSQEKMSVDYTSPDLFDSISRVPEEIDSQKSGGSRSTNSITFSSQENLSVNYTSPCLLDKITVSEEIDSQKLGGSGSQKSCGISSQEKMSVSSASSNLLDNISRVSEDIGSQKSAEISSQEKMSCGYASSNLLDNISRVSEEIDSQKSAGISSQENMSVDARSPTSLETSSQENMC